MLDLIRECGIDWGAVAQGVAAIGTVALFAAAFIGIKGEIRDRKVREEDRIREQARHVSAWPLNFEKDGAVGRLDVKIHNGSGEPVWDLRVIPVAPHLLEIQPYEAKIYPPDSKIENLSVHPGADRSHLPDALDADSFDLHVEFQDARGIRWIRETNGSLTRV